MDTFYKVVKVDYDGKEELLVSVNNIWQVVYQLNKTVKPSMKSKLFAFKELARAVSWLERLILPDDWVFGGPRYFVYECLVENPEPARFCAISTRDMWDFWKGNLHRNLTTNTPTGSYFVDSVTLTKLVWTPS